jgi:putative protein kinase ArgK-like GTPase of G3E family
MEEKRSSIGVTLLRMRMQAWSFSLGTVASLWETTEKFIDEVLAKNSWCPGVVKFAGRWAEGSKKVCHALKETMNQEFKTLEEHLSGKEKVEEKVNNPLPPSSH